MAASRALPVVASAPSASSVSSASVSPGTQPNRDPALRRTLGMMFVTRRCNLDCSYCHMEHETIPDTPLPTLKKGIDLLLAHSSSTMFHWFGGEPLLRFDLIEWGVKYIAGQVGPDHKIKHFITTNGLLLHRHFDWLRDHGFGFMLSVDGTLESQGAFRKAFGNDQRGPYEKIFTAMERMNREGVDYFCNMCISPENVDRTFENVRYLKERGVKRVQLGYELGALWDADGRRRYMEGLSAAITELHGKDGFTIQNGPHSEPVLGNPFFVVDCNGDMFNGTAVVLEKTMPAFNEAARFGHIDQIESLEGHQRERLAQVTYFMRGTRHNEADWTRLRSNMHLGYVVRRMLTRMGHNA